MSACRERSEISVERGRREGAGGAPIEALHLRIPGGVEVRLRIDARFAARGIVTSGRLIDLAATEARWGEPVGRFPEEWLADAAEGAMAVCPTNFGWQREALLVERGRLVSLPEDRLRSGVVSLFGRRYGRWEATELRLVGGSAAATDAALLRGFDVALEAPAIVREGAPVSSDEWIVHPRLLADLRNAFDFAHGRGTELAPELWIELRKALPESAASALALAGGRGCRERRRLADPARLRSLLADARLDHISVRDAGEVAEIEIRGPLPPTRLPLLGIGVAADGALDLTAIDGRRPGRPGATIAELARIMVERGVVHGGLGSAGGDVAVVQRTRAGSALRNVPSTFDSRTGRFVSRRVPAVLIAG